MILNLTELSSEPLHSQISRQLRARILSGAVPEGSELPPVHTFARSQRVSAISVQRAFEDLAAEGLLHLAPDGAASIAKVSGERRRDLAQQRLLETLREQEFSVKELELARDIQCRLLPPPEVSGSGWRVVARNEPARFVAGDFYDVLRPGDGSIGVVVADVAGKGIGPSLLMASVKAVLPYIAVERDVRETLAELNRRLRHELGRREFVALCLARYKPSTGRLEVGNAGLPDPYLLRSGARVEAVEVPGERLPLGLRDEVAYGSAVLTLEPGDRVLLLSDGLPEAEHEDGGPLGYERFEARLARQDEPSADAWLEGLLECLRQETSTMQQDDWTALLLERTEQEPLR
ncbi:MAG: SpoIIE family protein phosphatase [Thermoanaerobaculia bacterium]|nr:SpoIIE family protein phosphatase [Thermoanaerobaculia bacterium]